MNRPARVRALVCPAVLPSPGIGAGVRLLRQAGAGPALLEQTVSDRRQDDRSGWHRAAGRSPFHCRAPLPQGRGARRRIVWGPGITPARGPVACGGFHRRGQVYSFTLEECRRPGFRRGNPCGGPPTVRSWVRPWAMRVHRRQRGEAPNRRCGASPVARVGDCPSPEAEPGPSRPCAGPPWRGKAPFMPG